MKIVSKWDGRISVERTQRSKRYRSYKSEEQARGGQSARAKAEAGKAPSRSSFDDYTMLAAQLLSEHKQEHGQISDRMMVHSAYQEALDRKSGNMPNGSFYQEAS